MPVVYFLCTLGNFSRVLLFNILLFVYQKKIKCGNAYDIVFLIV